MKIMVSIESNAEEIKDGDANDMMSEIESCLVGLLDPYEIWIIETG